MMESAALLTTELAALRPNSLLHLNQLPPHQESPQPN